MIKALTYNIHKGFSVGRLKYMLPRMRDALSELSPDLMFLQEVRGEHKRMTRPLLLSPSNQFEFLAEEIWPHRAYGKNAIYHSGHHGNAILSKYPFQSFENINLSTVIRASRSLLHGIIELPEHHTRLHTICIHLGLFKAERIEQVSTLCERIRFMIPDDEPLIIAGDFNDWRKNACEILEGELGLKEVFKESEGDFAKSYPAWGPTFRTDRIYYRDLTLKNYERLTEKRWRVLSDHLPLIAEFSI